jgi:hypothetical protein
VTTHRGPAQPRYGRIAALGASVVVTLLSALAGLGVLGNAEASGVPDSVARPASYLQSRSPSPTATSPTTVEPTVRPNVRPPASRSSTDSAPSGPTTSGGHTDAPTQAPLPAASGQGRRIVFSQHLQRVWLVGAHDDRVQKTYLVSGSVTDNLQPGTYAVYSRSRWATGIDDSGVMQYFVRFTQGPTGAAIGFHSIPTKDGTPLQTTAELGTPQSHGCIRQWKPDAIALWKFAPVDTKVVVVA